MSYTQKGFKIELENYRVGLETILPNYLTGIYTDDEALVDEVTNILHSRDWLESALAAIPRYARENLAEIERLDQSLLTMKDKLLEKIEGYTKFREHLPRPQSHWWYYLDQVVTRPSFLPNRNQSVQFWLPLS